MTDNMVMIVACLLVVGGCASTAPVSPADDAGTAVADTASETATDGRRAVDSPADKKTVDGQAAVCGDAGQADAAVIDPSKVMAFPGAQGFGAETPGGRGGKVIEVTNLSDDNMPGSFRHAVQSSGPRIVVFRVSGTITMTSDIAISGAAKSFLTIAGQTSPGGIQLKGPTYSLLLNSGAHDLVVRHLRLRSGATNDDSYTTSGTFLLSRVSNVVVDHCSAQWSNHNMMGSYEDVKNVTFQWNIMAEASRTSATTGNGFIMTGAGSRENIVTFHHNLVAHVFGGISGSAKVFDVRNNLVYDWTGNAGLSFSSWPDSPSQANVVNNHFLPGPSSGTTISNYLKNGGGGTKVFAQGNWAALCPVGCKSDWSMFGDFDGPSTGLPASTVQARFGACAPFPAAPVTTQPIRELKDVVLANAGATKPRDALDARIVSDVMNKVGFDPDKVGRGTWPVLSGPEPPPDRDHDGMPDAWETAHSLNPDDPKDGPAVAKNKYTNVENYLNELAGDPVP